MEAKWTPRDAVEDGFPCGEPSTLVATILVLTGELLDRRRDMIAVVNGFECLDVFWTRINYG